MVGINMAKHQFFEDIRKFPNLLCLYRFFIILISLVLFVYFGLPVIASLLGLTAGLTDYWDGIYARKHNMVTRLGALLDTVTDLMFTFLVMVAALHMGVWPIWIVWLWGLRDLSMLAMRTSAAQLGFDIPSSMLGKVASNFIYYALFLMPLVWALNDSSYMYADVVARYIHPYVGVGLDWITLCACIAGLVMQWISAYGYARVYITKYDEVHRKDADDKALVVEPLELGGER